MTIIRSRQPTKLGPRVDFRPEEFRKFIFKAGLELMWEQAQECPCIRKLGDLTLDAAFTPPTGSRTAESRVDCPLCKGKGYFYHSAQRIKAGVTTATENPERFRAYGAMSTGMISLSLLPEHLPSWGDRFTMVNSVLLYRETRIRTAADGDTEELSRPIVARTLDTQDQAGNADPMTVNVLNVHKANADGTTAANLKLTSGTDYSIIAMQNADHSELEGVERSVPENYRVLRWKAGGNAPAVGERFAVSYYTHPRYVVIDHPHAFRDTFVKFKNPDEVFAPLPVMCNARLDFLGTEDE